MAQLPYMTPAALINLRKQGGENLKVGDTLDFHTGTISMAAHPGYGPIPVIRVTEVTEDGRFAGGEFTCTSTECNETVHVHPGDIFQKRRCSKCQKTHQGKAKRGIRNPDDEAKVKAEREAAKLAKQAAKAEKKYQATIEKAQQAAKDAQERLDKLNSEQESRRQLIEEEAKRQGVEVSPNAAA